MKFTAITALLSLLMGLGLMSFVQSETSTEKAIRKVIETFVKGGDQQDVSMLEGVLHESYRVVWNDPANGKVSVLDRATYLSFVEQKKFGGDTRELKIESISLQNEANASVKLFLDGKAADFKGLVSLVKADGKWQLVQDLTLME
ncbi:MAG: nuclear transport factor 2 family protein, partial [Bacteroidia bacterium]